MFQRNKKTKTEQKKNEVSNYWENYFRRSNNIIISSDKFSHRINYNDIFEQLKAELGLSEVIINLQWEGETRVRLDKIVQGKGIYTVSVLQNTNESVYKGDLRHELEHVVNYEKVLNYIGEASLSKMCKNENSAEYLAFNIIGEYLAWKAACTYVNVEESTLSIYAVCNNPYMTTRDKLDVIASHATYYEIHSSESHYCLKGNDDSIRFFDEEEQNIIDMIANVIREGACKWPMTLEQFNKIGTELFDLIALL